MGQDKILEFAKSQGHDRVGIKTLWNGFDVYLLGNPLATDVPQLAMVKEETVRLATPVASCQGLFHLFPKKLTFSAPRPGSAA